MMPISLLAFSSLFLGFSYVFPPEWFISIFISTLSRVIFTIFPISVYSAIIINFHKKKNNYTYISAAIFMLIFIGIQSVIVSTGIIPEQMITNFGSYTSYDGELKLMSPISMSMFSVILMAIIFIWLDGWINHKQMFVIYAILLTLILTPIFMGISVILWLIGLLISSIPFGIGTFFYGFINRLLLPFGMHTLFFPAFLFTGAGGSLEIYDSTGNDLLQVINGDSYIWQFMYTHGIYNLTGESGSGFYQGTEYVWKLVNTSNPGQYGQGFIPIITFAFPMLAISLIIRDGWQEKKNMLFLAMMTMCTGVTEMFEFTFIFINPWLYILNAVMVGLSFMLLNIFDTSVWISTGWSLDLILFGIIPAMKGFQTNWIYIPLVGVGIGIIYSLLYIIIDKYTSHNYINNTFNKK